MSFFNTLANLFKKSATASTDSDHQWREGYEAFQQGQDLYFQNEFQQALCCFDQAIQSGFESADIYGLRGGCLQKLEFDLDAIDDFTKAIDLESDDGNHYFMRSISKGAVGDLQGRVTDLKEAIRVAGIDNTANRSRNEWAKENGFQDGIVDKYQMDLMYANLVLEEQAADELRLKGPGPHRRPDLASRLRAKARRRE